MHQQPDTTRPLVPPEEDSRSVVTQPDAEVSQPVDEHQLLGATALPSYTTETTPTPPADGNQNQDLQYPTEETDRDAELDLQSFIEAFRRLPNQTVPDPQLPSNTFPPALEAGRGPLPGVPHYHHTDVSCFFGDPQPSATGASTTGGAGIVPGNSSGHNSTQNTREETSEIDEDEESSSEDNDVTENEEEEFLL